MTLTLAEHSLPPVCCLALFGGQLPCFPIKIPLHQVKRPASHASNAQLTCWRIWRRVRALRQQTQLGHDDSQV